MAETSDPFDLQRFLEAQGDVYEGVIGELRQGEKRSHWIWYIFPQVAGLANSAMSVRYAIASRAEASAYLAHPVLRARLTECTSLVLAVSGRPIGAILPHPDDLKFRSSMTLFATAADAPSIFHEALAKYFAGEPDTATLALLGLK